MFRGEAGTGRVSVAGQYTLAQDMYRSVGFKPIRDAFLRAARPAGYLDWKELERRALAGGKPNVLVRSYRAGGKLGFAGDMSYAEGVNGTRFRGGRLSGGPSGQLRSSFARGDVIQGSAEFNAVVARLENGVKAMAAFKVQEIDTLRAKLESKPLLLFRRDGFAAVGGIATFSDFRSQSGRDFYGFDFWNAFTIRFVQAQRFDRTDYAAGDEISGTLGGRVYLRGGNADVQAFFHVDTAEGSKRIEQRFRFDGAALIPTGFVAPVNNGLTFAPELPPAPVLPEGTWLCREGADPDRYIRARSNKVITFTAKDLNAYPLETKSRRIVGERSGNGQYQGQMYRYVRHGIGSMQFTNGTRYEGTWFRGQICGPGRMTYDNGATYEGLLMDGKPNGKGFFVGPDGARYEGQFAGGERNGTGTYVLEGRLRISGQWLAGQPHGQARYESQDGHVFEGNFVLGEPELGVHTFPDGRVTTGVHKNWKLSGLGWLEWPSGAKAHGIFVEDALRGPVNYRYQDGSILFGINAANGMNGLARVLSPDGSVRFMEMAANAATKQVAPEMPAGLGSVVAQRVLRLAACWNGSGMDADQERLVTVYLDPEGQAYADLIRAVPDADATELSNKTLESRIRRAFAQCGEAFRGMPADSYALWSGMTLRAAATGLRWDSLLPPVK